jgi:hypothetical protein
MKKKPPHLNSQSRLAFFLQPLDFVLFRLLPLVLNHFRSGGVSPAARPASAPLCLSPISFSSFSSLSSRHLRAS